MNPHAGKRPDHGETAIVVAPLVLVGFILAAGSYAAGWLKGGHPERFGVAVLVTEHLISRFFQTWQVGGLYVGIAASEFLLLLVFGWLALHSTRWWPFIVTASLGLMLLVLLISTQGPHLSRNDIAAAHNGLIWLVNLAVFAGVGERWMAGERAVSNGRLWRNHPSAS